MSDYCVVLADAARARIFTLEPAALPEMESGPNLTEYHDLVNPEMEQADKDLWSEMKSGRNRASSGAAHGYDDHREKHADEFVARFARQVADDVVRVVNSRKAKHLVVLAEKRMLGFLRNTMGSGLNGVQVHEVAKNLSKLSTAELHNRLAQDGLLPKRQRPTG